MWYFICLVAGASLGYVIRAVMAAGARADRSTDMHALNQRAESLDRANGVLRRELFELRATYEPTRDHGYGAPRG